MIGVAPKVHPMHQPVFVAAALFMFWGLADSRTHYGLLILAAVLFVWSFILLKTADSPLGGIDDYGVL